MNTHFRISEKSEIIRKTFQFIHNIPYDIIDQAWDPIHSAWINQHLKNKYSMYCKKDGYASPNAVLAFMSSLDDQNSRIFCETIVKNIESFNL